MAESDEKNIKDLINKFNKQQSAFLPNSQFAGDSSQGIDVHTGIDNQGIVDKSSPLPPGIVQPPKAHVPAPTGNICPQCNMVHPPLKVGEKCPNAVVKSMTSESEEVIVDVNKYLVALQNILMSKIDEQKIKDVNKLFQNITLEITKFLEGYKE